MISYSQRDPRWSFLKLGKSQLSMGRYGCTTTAIADLSTYFGDNLNPQQMVQKIRYTPDGLVIWQSCSFKNFVFERREYGRNDANIKAALKDPNRAVILQVDDFHWVVATGSIFNWYSIADPWFGDKTFAPRYKRVTGAAYFKRK